MPSWRLWILPLICWIALILWDIIWNFHVIDNNILAIAKDRGESFFKHIEITRFWNASHGGVYAPITKNNKPNPFLNVPNRDIVTLDGMELTMINPAYMTRQISEIANNDTGVKFHITSLNPIRAGNAPDAWEKATLNGFENGKNDKIEYFKDNATTIFRYMAPLYVKKECIKCHGMYGTEVGDLRGGISITIPAGTIMNASKTQKINLLCIYIPIYFIGVGCIFFFRIYSHRQWLHITITEKKPLLLMLMV